MEYLDFELPIKELEEQLAKCEVLGKESDVDVSAASAQIQQKLEETKINIYQNLTAWQRVQLSRHPNRPYTMDYVKALLLVNKKDLTLKPVNTVTLVWQTQKVTAKHYV